MPKRFAIIAAALAREGRAIPAAIPEDWLARSVILSRTSQPDAGPSRTKGNYRTASAANPPLDVDAAHPNRGV